MLLSKCYNRTLASTHEVPAAATRVYSCRCAEPARRPMGLLACEVEHPTATSQDQVTRRALNLAVTTLFAGAVQQLLYVDQSQALTSNPLGYKKELKQKRRKIPESEYSDGPEGIKYYDITVGGGAEAQVGQRVAVHIDVKWRNITFMTSRQGIGVTGGSPIGFDVGQPVGAAGSTLPGLDLGVRGMRVGGQRRLLVPPALGYGSKGYGEIPPDATIQIDVELLSIKTNPLGYRTKLVEG